MRLTVSLLATLFAAVASADSVLIPSPLAEIDYDVSVTDDYGYYASSGNVRTRPANGFDAETGGYRVEVRPRTQGAEEYVAEIRLARDDGGNWREVDGDRFTLTGRFGAEVERTFHYSDATLILKLTVSQEMLNIGIDPAPESDSGLWLVISILALLVAVALIVLYIRRP